MNSTDKECSPNRDDRCLIPVLLRFLLLAFSILLCASSAAQACTCGGPGPVCIAAKRADAVFIGRVVRVDAGSVEVDVERAISGAQPGRMAIGNGPGNCGLAFRQGERYVVYAHRDPASGVLFTGMCTRTRPLTDPQTRADPARRSKPSRQS